MAQVTFRIHYFTRWGESLRFERRFSAADDPGARTETLPMHHAGDGHWTLSLDACVPGERIAYRYVFHRDPAEDTQEPVFRHAEVGDASLSVYDEWLPPELPEAALLRQAFAGTIFNPGAGPVPPAAGGGRVGLKLTLRAPRVMKGFRICVSGSSPLLGNWDPARARVTSGHRYPLWEVDVPRSDLVFPVEFKFGLWSESEQRLVQFETGPNRRLGGFPDDPGGVVFNCAYFRHALPWKGAGVAIPVFSLRSRTGYGIGEFVDLEPFAQWAADCGMHLVQILPVNDTTSDYSWRDSYPYKAISAMALHPVYLHISGLFEQYHVPLPEGYIDRRDALNRLPQVDYVAVLKDKLAYLRELYAGVGARALRSRAFREFFRENGHWLKPYAAFCRLRDLHATADFTRWGRYATCRKSDFTRWFKPGAAEYDEVMFHCFVQFHLEHQLNQALSAGRARGVAFMGDLPIGTDRCSVEAWTEPELFRTDRQTGAPPDSFAVLGQNWGFPTYDWEKMAADGYAWWRRRLRRLSTCFDALRIDHILGFFRIWEIPGKYSEGIMGHFKPAQPLSRNEIRTFGFHRDPAVFAVPSVAERDLPAFFGDAAAKVAAHLLRRAPDGYLSLKPEYEAPETREAWYATQCAAEEAIRIRDGLKRLGFEVLFLTDPDLPAHFHPRVTLQQTHLFASFNADERAALARLHDDFFYRRQDRLWEEEAMRKLPVFMDATRMLICGEDLGMIPAVVPGVLKRLGILSLEVQRMPKQPGQLFGIPEQYPFMSVCTTSTHDMATLRGWWEEDNESRQQFYRQVMHRDGEAPRECTPEICRWVVWLHLAGASMWCILPLQDWLALDGQLRYPVAADERINVPAVPRHYWRYRMHLTIEELRTAADFNQLVSGLIRDTGRNPLY